MAPCNSKPTTTADARYQVSRTGSTYAEDARCQEIRTQETEARFFTIRNKLDRRNGAQGRVPQV